MTVDLVVELANKALYTVILTSAPVLIISLVIGLIVSIFQTVTSIQEQTLTFVDVYKRQDTVSPLRIMSSDNMTYPPEATTQAHVSGIVAVSYTHLDVYKRQKPSMLEFVEDRTLGKNECLIETPDGIYDCSLSVQLSELKRKLLLLSYSGAKEQ